MDDSWDFLKDAPENELALVIDACKKSSINVQECATATDIINSIGEKYHCDALSYEQFLDEVCRQNKLFDVDNRDSEEKGLKLLEYLLGKGIDRMSNEQIIRFATDYLFSNLDKEKLKREAGVRLKTSNELNESNDFKAKLFHIVPAFWGIDFTQFFSSNVSDVEKLFLNDANIDIINGSVTATLIALRNEHYLLDTKFDYTQNYIDSIIKKDTSFNYEKRYAILSVMLSFVKNTIEGDDEYKQHIIDDASSFLEKRVLAVPEYIINHCLDKKDLIKHLMELLNPCDDKVKGSYRQMSHKSQGFPSIAFFDYKFPFTSIIEGQDAYYLIPDNDFNRIAIKLYLLSQGINPNKHLISEEDLRNKSLDCAVIPMDSNPNDYLSFPKQIQLENPFITGFREFIQKMGTIDEGSSTIIEALNGFMQLDRGTMDILASEMDKKAHNMAALEGLNHLVHLICNLRN